MPERTKERIICCPKDSIGEPQKIGRVLKMQRELLILAEAVCVRRFIQTL